jgi:hypothetical protein
MTFDVSPFIFAAWRLCVRFLFRVNSRAFAVSVSRFLCVFAAIPDFSSALRLCVRFYSLSETEKV